MCGSLKNSERHSRSAKPSPSAQPPRCVQCGSQRIWKDGIRYTKNGDVQRYICRECGYRFSQTSLNISNPSNNPEHDQTVHTKQSNSSYALPSNRQVCVALAEGTKNLAKVETRIQKQAAGATTYAQKVKGLLALYEVKLIHRGLKERTIKGKLNTLKLLIKRNVNILDPKSVWHAIDKMRKYNHATGELQEKEWTDGSKKNATIAYRDFAETSGIHIPEDLNFHKYSSRPKKLPFIPLESDINALIAGASSKAASFLQLLKETWARAGEAWSLEWIDLDSKRNIVTINNPEKNGMPRQIKVSSQLISMLNRLPKNSQKVFGNGMLQHFRKNFVLQRKRIAHKLKSPRINKITFHTLRHWGATMEYHRTKDILHVKERLGHRSITSTLVYTHLVNFEGDEFHVRVAKNLKQDKELIEAGFEYVTERDGAKIYRKRK